MANNCVRLKLLRHPNNVFDTVIVDILNRS